MIHKPDIIQQRYGFCFIILIFFIFKLPCVIQHCALTSLHKESR